MNTRIENLISAIEKSFKSIYGQELESLKEVSFETVPNGFTTIDLGLCSESEVQLIIERTLMGINHYIVNIIPNDTQRNGFPIASFNSIINAIKNNQNQIIVYTKKIPAWNQELHSVLELKGFI